MNLSEALTLLAKHLDVDPAELIAYAVEDEVGGYHTDPAQARWPVGSLWEVEGKLLYALVRHIKPARVVEIGTLYGSSATHILSALDANDMGELISIDKAPKQGSMVPEHLRSRWKLVEADAVEWMSKTKLKAEIIFEDALHDPDGTLAILQVAQRMKPHIVLSHDSEHYIVGADIRSAWMRAISTVEMYRTGVFATVLIGPSDCGIAWWVRP